MMIAERLRRVERRLGHLLAGGRRDDGTDVAVLRDEATALADLGFVELAERLRRVAALDDQYVPALALALTACRLLRARLPDDAPPPGDWDPLVATRGRRQGGERLVPIGRVALAEGEAWACVRLRGYDFHEWLLVAPPPQHPDDGVVPWLMRPLHAFLRWEARLPLGARGDVQVASIAESRWPEIPGVREDPCAPLRQALAAGELLSGKSAYLEHGRLRVLQLEAEDAAGCVWPDPAMVRAFQGATRSPVWAIAWVDGPLVTPLAIVEPGDGTRPTRLLHLVDGSPAEDLIG